MNKTAVVKFIKDIQNGVSKHRPGILTGIGIAGMVTTTILAVKATPKAIRLINEKEQEELEKDENFESLSKVDIVKTAWKPYIPAVVTGTVSVACLIGASSVNAKRNAALATAYQISQTALHDYKAKVVETIGEKKEKVIREQAAKEKVEQNPVSKREVIITGGGDTLCYDITAGQYFKSDIEKIKKTVNELNRRMTYEMYISWNEFFDELGMKTTPMGDELGWNIDDGLIELDYSSQLTDDGTPCITIEYLIAPKYDYSKLM